MYLLARFKKLMLIFLLARGLAVKEVAGGIGLRPVDFFRLGDEDLTKETKIFFRVGEGLKLRQAFERRYGVRGEALIRSLGEGSGGNAVKTA